MKIENINDLDWLDIPPAEAVQDAELLLDQIGTRNGMEQRLARYPLSPRLSRILVEALDRGIGRDGCLAAAILGPGARSGKNDLLVPWTCRRTIVCGSTPTNY
jgi:ATP-dependent helicase HrpB